MKMCIKCIHFEQLRYKGGDKWYNYCRRDGYYNPCSGEKCEFPKYFKATEK